MDAGGEGEHAACPRDFAIPVRTRSRPQGDHRAYDRTVPPGRADRRPYAWIRQRPAHDDIGAYAVLAPVVRWTIERIARDATAVGPCAALLCEKILEERPHPEQGFRACLGIMRLVRGFGRERVEAACGRALDIGARTYGSVGSILDNRLDQSAPRPARDDRTITHPNIRALASVRARLFDLRRMEKVLHAVVRACDADEHAGCPLIETLSADTS